MLLNSSKFIFLTNRLFATKVKKVLLPDPTDIYIPGNVLQRKFPYEIPSPEWAKGKYPIYDEKYNTWENVPDIDKNKDYIISRYITVILNENIPGLGTKNSVVEVHKSRFYRYLFPLKLAEMATPERLKVLEPCEQKILVGETYVTYKKLQNIILPISMNVQKQWVLNKRNVKISLRKNGIFIKDENQIELPKDSITNKNCAELFDVYINIENIEKAKVTCKIFFYENIDNITITHPKLDFKENLIITDWLSELMEIPVKYKSSEKISDFE